jgi:hypothetical protein
VPPANLSALIERAVLETDGVLRLEPSLSGTLVGLGRTVTSLGRPADKPVDGIVITSGSATAGPEIRVELALRWGRPATEVAEDVRTRVLETARGAGVEPSRVDVWILSLERPQVESPS